MNKLSARIIKEQGKLRVTEDDWGDIESSSGTQGMFMKKIIKQNGKTFYLKASGFDSENGFTGYESYYEVIASRLAKILDIPCIKCYIASADIVYKGKKYKTDVMISESYNPNNFKRISFEDLYVAKAKRDDKGNIETAVAFAKRVLGEEYLSKMLMFDFIIINRDRHGANIELLLDEHKLITTPLFDNGCSFMMFSKTDEERENFEIMRDRAVNNYIGSKSLKDNLKYVNKAVRLNKLEDKHKEVLFNGLDKLTEYHKTKLWSIIKERYNYVSLL